MDLLEHEGKGQNKISRKFEDAIKTQHDFVELAFVGDGLKALVLALWLFFLI